MDRADRPALAGVVIGAMLVLGGAGVTAVHAGGSSGANPHTDGAAAVQTAQAARSDAARADRSARAEFVDRQGERVGNASLEQTPHGVLIRVELQNVPPGVRGFHIHETGQCSPTFEAAGEHFNPRDREHGFQNPRGVHAGDLPNIHVPENGRLTFEVLARDVTLEPDPRHSLLAGDGTALVIHERADDYRSHPSGEAGGRIACAVIRG